MTDSKTTLLGRHVGVNEQRRKEARIQKLKSGVTSFCSWFKRGGWVIVLAIGMLAIVGYQQRFYLQRFNPLEYRYLQYVEIEGNRMLSWDDVIQNAQIETGMKMSDLHEDSVKNILLQLPLIKAVEVSKEFPSTLKIKLQETSAVVSVFDGNHITSYSEKGLPMSIARASAMRLPILNTENLDKVKPVTSFLTAMRKLNISLYEKVSQIDWSEKDKAFQVFFRDAGYHVLFPSSNWTESLFALYETLGSNFAMDLKCAKEVDLRFPGFAYVRNYEKRCVNG